MQTDATNYQEIRVFLDISISPVNFANMSNKYITNLASSNVTLALATLHQRHWTLVQRTKVHIGGMFVQAGSHL